jgi:hypothetical protein
MPDSCKLQLGMNQDAGASDHESCNAMILQPARQLEMKAAIATKCSGSVQHPNRADAWDNDC